MDPEPTPQDSITENARTDEAADQLLVAEDLIEEVSIDGMCGVY